jgi:hypothetical protein
LLSGGEWHQPRLPPQQLDQPTLRHLGRLREPLARVRVVRAQFPVHRAAHTGFSPPGVLDQGATLDALRECATVGLALASLLRLEAMQLVAMLAPSGGLSRPDRSVSFKRPARRSLDKLVWQLPLLVPR